MYEIEAYHGTNRLRGERIIANEQIELSIGDNHWLGDGSYFFEDDLYAYKWCVDMFYNRYKEYYTYNHLIEEYMILRASIKTEQSRIFDLTHLEGKSIFDITYKNLMVMAEYSEKFKNYEIADGVVINYLFKELGYSYSYDVVRAVFIKYKNNYRGIKTRQGFVCETQLCIKNINVIDKIYEYNFDSKVSKYESIWNNLINIDSMYKEKNTYNKYKAYRTGYKL